MANGFSLGDLVQKYKAFMLMTGGIYPAILAAISDFFKPLFSTTLYLVLFLLFLLAAEFIFYKAAAWSARIGKLNEDLARESGGKWFYPFFLSSIMALVIFLWTYAQNADSEDGALAEHFAVVASMQKELGMLNRHLADISEHTRKSAEHLEHMDKNMSGLKQEVSDNPRKELANMGIQWSDENYLKAMRHCDLPALRLFWAGGMDPMERHVLENSMASFSTPYVFVCMDVHHPNWEKLFNIYLANEFFDLNAKKYSFYPWFKTDYDAAKAFGEDEAVFIYNGLLHDYRFSPAQIFFLKAFMFPDSNKGVNVLRILMENGANPKDLGEALERVTLVRIKVLGEVDKVLPGAVSSLKEAEDLSMQFATLLKNMDEKMEAGFLENLQKFTPGELGEIGR